MGLQVRAGVIFVAEKRLQRLFFGLLQLFAVIAWVQSPFAPIAQTMTTRSTN